MTTVNNLRDIMNIDSAHRTGEDRLFLGLITSMVLGVACWIVGLLLALFIGFELNQPGFILFMTGTGFMTLTLVTMIVSMIHLEIRSARAEKKARR